MTHQPTGRKPKDQPHPHQRLTDRTIRTLRQPGRYADGNGLYLEVEESGAKHWLWRGVIEGKRCDLGLGGFHKVPLKTAREETQTLHQQIRAGVNPLHERRRSQRTIPTFTMAARAVYAEHSPHFKNEKHRWQWLATLETHAFDVIGDRRINTITSEDILKVLSPIWMVIPETARRVKQRIKLVFDWAKANGYYAATNPTEGLTKVLPKHKGDSQHLAALPYQDVPAFVAALQTIPQMQPVVRGALELVIVTAARTNEVRLATWDEIDLDARTWTIPAGRMKAQREHKVPLSDRAVAILTQLSRRNDTDLVFPGTKPGQPLSNVTLLKASRRLTTARLTVHGFRSSFRDWSAERTSIPRDVCEAALAHTVKDKTEAAYLRSTLFEKRRELMELWGRFVTRTPATVHAIGA